MIAATPEPVIESRPSSAVAARWPAAAALAASAALHALVVGLAFYEFTAHARTGAAQDPPLEVEIIAGGTETPETALETLASVEGEPDRASSSETVETANPVAAGEAAEAAAPENAGLAEPAPVQEPLDPSSDVAVSPEPPSSEEATAARPQPEALPVAPEPADSADASAELASRTDGGATAQQTEAPGSDAAPVAYDDVAPQPGSDSGLEQAEPTQVASIRASEASDRADRVMEPTAAAPAAVSEAPATKLSALQEAAGTPQAEGTAASAETATSGDLPDLAPSPAESIRPDAIPPPESSESASEMADVAQAGASDALAPVVTVAPAVGVPADAALRTPPNIQAADGLGAVSAAAATAIAPTASLEASFPAAIEAETGRVPPASIATGVAPVEEAQPAMDSGSAESVPNADASDAGKDARPLPEVPLAEPTGNTHSSPIEAPPSIGSVPEELATLTPAGSVATPSLLQPADALDPEASSDAAMAPANDPAVATPASAAADSVAPVSADAPSATSVTDAGTDVVTAAASTGVEIKGFDPAEGIENTISAYACSRINAEYRIDDQGVVASGHLKSDVDRADLLKRLSALPGVARVDPSELYVVGEPYCNVLSFFDRGGFVRSERQRQGIREFGDPVQAGVEHLAKGEPLKLSVSAPDFESFMYIDYFTADRAVVHLVPSGPSPDNRFQPKKNFMVGGSNGEGFEIWIGPPFGLDFVVAIGSSAPLFDEPRPTQESADVYLEALASAIAGQKANGEAPRLEYAYWLIFTTEEKTAATASPTQ